MQPGSNCSASSTILIDASTPEVAQRASVEEVPAESAVAAPEIQRALVADVAQQFQEDWLYDGVVRVGRPLAMMHVRGEHTDVVVKRTTLEWGWSGDPLKHRPEEQPREVRLAALGRHLGRAPFKAIVLGVDHYPCVQWRRGQKVRPLG
jgi:hypothetical protein